MMIVLQKKVLANALAFFDVLLLERKKIYAMTIRVNLFLIEFLYIGIKFAFVCMNVIYIVIHILLIYLFFYFLL